MLAGHPSARDSLTSIPAELGMDTLPLARLTKCAVVRLDAELLFYLEGVTSGFDGSFTVERSPDRRLPPGFIVRELPGNTGINPGASPAARPTRAAVRIAGDGVPDSEIRVQDAEGESAVEVLPVTDAAPAGESDGGGGGEGEGAEEGPAAGPEEGKWSAIHNFMPLDRPRLRVRGMPLMPTPGFRVTLTRAEPQGINPRILILDLTATPPDDVRPAVRAPAPAEYDEETDAHFDSVEIRSAAVPPPRVRVPVQEVH